MGQESRKSESEIQSKISLRQTSRLSNPRRTQKCCPRSESVNRWRPNTELRLPPSPHRNLPEQHLLNPPKGKAPGQKTRRSRRPRSEHYHLRILNHAYTFRLQNLFFP